MRTMYIAAIKLAFVKYFISIFTLFSPYKLSINGTKIGTANVQTAPVIKAINATSESVDFEIIGKLVSIAVAPAGAIASINPIFFATKGIVVIAISSLITFDIKANAESSLE